MLNLLIELLVLFLVLALAMISMVGWGRFVLQILRFNCHSSWLDSRTSWIGFCALLTVIEFLNLFVPIDWKVSLFLCILGLTSAVLGYGLEQMKSLKWSNLSLFIKFNWLTVCILLFVLLWTLRAMGSPNNIDSGLYHFASIRWMNEYPITPGVGNLHWRLALNQSYFGFLALLNIEPYWRHGSAAGGLLLLSLTAWSAFQIAAQQNPIFKYVFGCILFVYFGYLAGTISNPSPDTAVSLLEIVIFMLLVRLIYPNSSGKSLALCDLVTLLFLCFSVITIKLSSLMFAGSSAIIATFIFIYRYRNTANLHVWLLLFLLLLLSSFIHFLRGYLLSGMPLFPSWVGALHGLPWSVPVEVAKFETSLIYSWAKSPGNLEPDLILNNWTWFSVWARAQPILFWLFLFISTLFTFFNLSISILRKNSTPELNLLYVPIITSLIFWFFTAPDIRFLGVVPVLFLSLSLWLFIHNTHLLKQLTFEHKLSKYILFACVSVACLLSLKMMGLRSISLSGWHKPILTDLKVKQTNSGLKIYIPKIGSNCWDSPIPCAPFYNEYLRQIQSNLPFGNKFYFSIK